MRLVEKHFIHIRMTPQGKFGDHLPSDPGAIRAPRRSAGPLGSFSLFDTTAVTQQSEPYSLGW